MQGAGRLPVVRCAGDEPHRIVVADGAGDADDGVIGAVLAFHILAHGIKADGGYRVGGAADVPTHSLLRPQGAVDEQAAHFAGVIVGHPQFVQDNFPLLFHFGGVQQRVAHQVDNHRQGAVGVDAGYFAPE